MATMSMYSNDSADFDPISKRNIMEAYVTYFFENGNYEQYI